MKRALAALLLLVMAPLARADGAAAVTGADPGPASLPGDLEAPNELYLEASVNAVSTGLILRFTQVVKTLRSSVSVANLQELGLDPAAQTPPSRVTPGAVLNDEAYTELGQTRRAARFNDVRYLNDSGVFSNTGTVNLGADQRKYMRCDTFWSHADPETQQTWQLGGKCASRWGWETVAAVVWHRDRVSNIGRKENFKAVIVSVSR